jgi:hypothetical protein
MKHRIVFRALVALTLAIMTFTRWSGGRMPPAIFPPFYYWFVISIFVFAGFGLVSAWHAIQDPPTRRAYLTDIVLAAAWVPYWFANFR